MDLNYYKQKTKDLEGEVSRLKQRLNDLRKAKNSVMIKREREIIHVGHPQGKEATKKPAVAPAPSPVAISQPAEATVKTAKYKELEKERDSLASQVKKLQEERMLLSRNMVDEKRRAEGYKEELDNLMERLELKSTQQETKQFENKHRESYINDLMSENADLRKKNDKLVDDLSVKEAKWLEKEEVYKHNEAHLKHGSSDKYAKWVADTEKKIEELRVQNLMLRDCLNRGVPRNSKAKKESSET